MYYSTHTITGKPTNLQTPLEVTNVGVTDVFFSNGWYNLEENGSVRIGTSTQVTTSSDRGNGGEVLVRIEWQWDIIFFDTGFYTFATLKK